MTLGSLWDDSVATLAFGSLWDYLGIALGSHLESRCGDFSEHAEMVHMRLWNNQDLFIISQFLVCRH